MKRPMSRPDPHSYADDAQPRTQSFDWRARVDFDTRQLSAEVTLTLASPPARDTAIDLDTRDLTIEAVTDEAGKALGFTLHPAEPILGARLEVQVPAGAKKVTRALPHLARGLGAAVARAGADHGRPAALPLQPVPGDSRALGAAPARTRPAFASRYTASLDVPQRAHRA